MLMEEAEALGRSHLATLQKCSEGVVGILGRFVRKGGHLAKKALAPRLYKVCYDDGWERWIVGGFTIASVFRSSSNRWRVFHPSAGTTGTSDLGDGPSGAWDALAALVERQIQRSAW